MSGQPNFPREKEISNEIYANRDDINGLARVFRSSKVHILNSPLLKKEMNKVISKFKDSTSEVVEDIYLEIYDEINSIKQVNLRPVTKSYEDNYDFAEENKAIVVNGEGAEMLPSSQRKAIRIAKEETNAGEIIDCLTHGINQLTKENKEIKASDLMAAAQAASAVNNTVDTILKVSEFLNKSKKSS